MLRLAARLTPHGRALKLGAAGLALAASGATGWTVNGWRWESKIADEVTAAAKLKAQQYAAARDAERQVLAAQIATAEELVRHAQVLVAETAASRADADRAGARLRDAFAAYRPGCQPAAGAALGGAGRTAAATSDLRTDVLARMELAGRDLSEYADRLSGALFACRAQYQALKRALDGAAVNDSRASP